MADLPSMPKDASLFDVFRMFPATNEPLIAFHETLLRDRRRSRKVNVSLSPHMSPNGVFLRQRKKSCRVIVTVTFLSVQANISAMR
jgi:hypothetical protein